MKVRFNKPSRRFTNKFSFDNNTTLGVGNVQPLFCKQLCAGSKFSVSFNQLTRLSPLVVPTFARLKQRNDFVFVPMAQVMPSFDAFLSHSLIHGISRRYIPDSVPCTTNSDLFVDLVYNYSNMTLNNGSTYNKNIVTLIDTYNINHTFTNAFANAQTLPTLEQLPLSYFDFVLDKGSRVIPIAQSDSTCIKLDSEGRFWLSVLRGLGYTLDPNDNMPVSILPLWAFIKAYYDIYYPKRDDPWHASNIYHEINKFYNGIFVTRKVGSLTYNMVDSFDCLKSIFGNDHHFNCYATLDDSLVTAATSQPINMNSSAGNQLTPFNLGNHSVDEDYSAASVKSSPSIGANEEDGSYIPVTTFSTKSSTSGITADQLRLVDRLWNFVQKSSVVGQSVKDWFSVHLGVKPNEDMFDQTILVDSIINDVSINTVISTAQTSNGNVGDNLGALAGQGYASKSGGVHFEAKTFGFFLCLTSIVPLSGVSCGTQPELYQNTLYEQQLPDFDGLGYEVLNKSCFLETFVSSNIKNAVNLSTGFGYVPRLSSWKSLHNIRSGNFAVNSVKDSLIPYNVDVLPNSDYSAGIIWRFPWTVSANFVSFNRLFYNESAGVSNKYIPAPLDDNFMSQTAFDVSYTSYLKPLSDSYSVESLGKDLVSVKEQ